MKIDWIYLAETCASRNKSKTGFEHVRRPQHLCDSTVAPHSCHSGSGFLTCWTGVGELRRFCDTLSQGCVTGHRPQPQNPRRPKVAIMIILMEGVDVLSTSLRLLLRMLYASKRNKAKPSEQRLRRGRRRKTDRPNRPKKNPETRKRSRRGLGANPGHETSQNSHFPSAKTLLRLLSGPTWE